MAVNGIGGFNAVTPGAFSIKGIENDNEQSLSFEDFLQDALNKVNDLQLQSDKLTNDFAAGKTDNIHQVMIAAEKADLALQFTMQIRNKILDAYNEIMRIQI